MFLEVFKWNLSARGQDVALRDLSKTVEFLFLPTTLTNIHPTQVKNFNFEIQAFVYNGPRRIFRGP